MAVCADSIPVGVNLGLGIWGPGLCPADTGDGEHMSHVTPLSTEPSECPAHQAWPAAVDNNMSIGATRQVVVRFSNSLHSLPGSLSLDLYQFPGMAFTLAPHRL